MVYRIWCVDNVSDYLRESDLTKRQANKIVNCRDSDGRGGLSGGELGAVCLRMKPDLCHATTDGEPQYILSQVII